MNAPRNSILFLSLTVASEAAIVARDTLDLWMDAVSPRTSDIRLQDFDGFANGSEIGGIEFGPGMTVRTYAGSAVSPRVDDDSFFGGGWLVNRNRPGFDEFANGFVIEFSVPTFAVSLNDNPNEANRLRIYDVNGDFLGETSNGAGEGDVFLGLVSDEANIAYATVINLQPEDGVFGIDNLRIGVIPEPSTMVMGLLGLTFALGRRRSRGLRNSVLSH